MSTEPRSPPNWIDVAEKAQAQAWFFRSGTGVERVLTRSLVSDLPAEPFPIDALPPILRNAVEEVAAATKAPLPMVATCALTAAASAAQGLVNVRRSATLVGPISLNTLVVAASGERKTTVDNMMTAGLREWQARQAIEPALKC